MRVKLGATLAQPMCGHRDANKTEIQTWSGRLNATNRIRVPSRVHGIVKSQFARRYVCAATATADANDLAINHEQTPPPATHTHITEIRINDFALVDQQHLRLSPGLNVITGESGSGKSVLLEAINQLLGATASEDLVRTPAQVAVIEGHIAVAPADAPIISALLQSLGVPQKVRAPLEAGNSGNGAGISIRREIVISSSSSDGSSASTSIAASTSKTSSSRGGARSRCYLNGCATSLRVLRELGETLVDINGQHAAITLRNTQQQLALLDRLTGTTAAENTVSATWSSLQQSRAKLRALDELGDEEQRNELQQLADNVAAVGVELGEDVALRTKLRQLDGRRAAAERCRLVVMGIGGDGGGVLDALQQVESHLRAMTAQEERLAAASTTTDTSISKVDIDDDDDIDGSGSNSSSGIEGGEGGALDLLEQANEALVAAREALFDAESWVEKYGRRYTFDQREYDEASARLQQLERLMKEHDCSSVDELLEAAEIAENRLDAYFQASGNRENLEAEKESLEKKVSREAVELSRQRREAAGKLKSAVEEVLKGLAMEGASFEVKLTWMTTTKQDDGIAIPAELASTCGQSQQQPSTNNNDDDTTPIYYRMRNPGHLDSVEFLFAAGPGEPLRPLSAVASGGEAARLMLALKAAPSFAMFNNTTTTTSTDTNKDTTTSSGSGGRSDSSLVVYGTSPVLVLDEIDSGVGSRLGQPVAQILRKMVAANTTSNYTSTTNMDGTSSSGSESSSLAVAGQILAVSHLPQVAAAAQHHHVVKKGLADDGRVVTRFLTLEAYEDRKSEVEAMLGLGYGAADELMRASGW